MTVISLFLNEETEAKRLSASKWGAGTRNWTFLWPPQSFPYSPTLKCQPFAKSITILHPRQNQFLSSPPLLKVLPNTLYVLFFQYVLHYPVITHGSEFLKEHEFLKRAPCLIYLGGHSVWHVVGTQCRFVGLGKEESECCSSNRFF